jgi:hypothetical protein
MEGLLTQLIAIGAWFIIIDFPDKAAQRKSFISQFDIQLIKDRINKDRGDATPDLPHTWGNLGKHFLDWKLYALYVFLSGIVAIGGTYLANPSYSAFMFMSTTMPA